MKRGGIDGIKGVIKNTPLMVPPMDTALIYKSNALIEASYRLSVYEQRILLSCISQVRRDAPLTDQQLYTVSAQQIADITGTKLGTAYQNLKAAAERLYRREVTLKEAPNGHGQARVRLTRWVQTIEYRDSEGMVALRFGTDMVPYLSQLSAQFTRYALADVAHMDSAHAVRLYELLCQWRDAGKREVSTEWLREAFQLGDKYPAIKDFKRWVIIPAIEQINKHSPLWVKWEQKKTGRKISHFCFVFGEKLKEKKKTPQKKSATDCDKVPRSLYGIPMDVIERLARPGESYDDAALRLLSEAKKSYE